MWIVEVEVGSRFGIILLLFYFASFYFYSKGLVLKILLKVLSLLDRWQKRNMRWRKETNRKRVWNATITKG